MAELFHVCYCSLLLFSQGLRLQSAYWHHPTSARQAQSTKKYVRSEWSVLLNLYYWAIDFHFNHSLSTILSCCFLGTSPRTSYLAPSRLSSATSRCCDTCTIKIASFSLMLCNSFSWSIINYQPSTHFFTSLFAYCRSLRCLQYNQLNGPIPPQVGDLIHLESL